MIKSSKDNIYQITKIYEQAKRFMYSLNIHQWNDSYPSIITVEEDIRKQKLYSFFDKKDILYGVAYIDFDEEPTYLNIYDGSWMGDEKYATIHRLAIGDSFRGNGYSKDMMKEIVYFVKLNEINWIRIDTHRDNIIMQKFLTSFGFIYRGKVYLEDKSERLAYEYKIV